MVNDVRNANVLVILIVALLFMHSDIFIAFNMRAHNLNSTELFGFGNFKCFSSTLSFICCGKKAYEKKTEDTSNDSTNLRKKKKNRNAIRNTTNFFCAEPI